MKKYGVRGPLLNAGICHLCRGDVFAIMEVARHKYIDPGVAIIEPLLNPTLLSHQSLTLAPFFFSSFFGSFLLCSSSVHSVYFYAKFMNHISQVL